MTKSKKVNKPKQLTNWELIGNIYLFGRQLKQDKLLCAIDLLVHEYNTRIDNDKKRTSKKKSKKSKII